MVIYYILLGIILLFGLFYVWIRGKHARLNYLAAVFSVMFVLMAIRAETVGRDVDIYYAKFNQIAAVDDWSLIINMIPNAPIYCVLNKWVSLFGDYRLMLAVTAALILSSVAIYIYRFSQNIVLSSYCFVALFFYLHAFNISRQFLAIAFVLYSLCLRKNHKVWAALCFVMALGIHSLAIVSLPLLILNPDKMSRRVFALAAGIGVAGAAAFQILFLPVMNLFVSLFPRYQFYLNSGIYSVYNRSGGSIIVLNLFYVAAAVFSTFVVYGWIRGVRVKGIEASRLRYLTFAVLAGGAMGVVAGSFEAMARVLYFYQIHAICLLPNLIGVFKREKYLLAYGLLLVLLIPFTICLMRNFGDVVPYKLFF